MKGNFFFKKRKGKEKKKIKIIEKWKMEKMQKKLKNEETMKNKRKIKSKKKRQKHRRKTKEEKRKRGPKGVPFFWPRRDGPKHWCFASEVSREIVTKLRPEKWYFEPPTKKENKRKMKNKRKNEGGKTQTKTGKNGEKRKRGPKKRFFFLKKKKYITPTKQKKQTKEKKEKVKPPSPLPPPLTGPKIVFYISFFYRNRNEIDAEKNRFWNPDQTKEINKRKKEKKKKGKKRKRKKKNKKRKKRKKEGKNTKWKINEKMKEKRNTRRKKERRKKAAICSASSATAMALQSYSSSHTPATTMGWRSGFEPAKWPKCPGRVFAECDISNLNYRVAPLRKVSQQSLSLTVDWLWQQWRGMWREQLRRRYKHDKRDVHLFSKARWPQPEGWVSMKFVLCMWEGRAELRLVDLFL